MRNKQQYIFGFLILAFSLAGGYFWLMEKKSVSEEASSVNEALIPETKNESANAPETEVVATGVEENTSEKKSPYQVTNEICDTECQVYQSVPEALSYCRAVCGIAPTGEERPTGEGCETQTDIVADVCWRDQAVAKLDGSLCAKITDQQLRKSCEHRLAEESLDQRQSEKLPE
jgi:hypothetical protein